MVNRERISLTINRKVLSAVDATIDNNKIRNRSHAVEVLLSKALGDNKVSKAFILAGGKGTRLRPITYEIPKPMVPIKGRPLLEHTIDFLKKYDIRDIILSIGFLGEKIRDYFEQNGNKIMGGMNKNETLEWIDELIEFCNRADQKNLEIRVWA